MNKKRKMLEKIPNHIGSLKALEAADMENRDKRQITILNPKPIPLGPLGEIIPREYIDVEHEEYVRMFDIED